MLKKLRRRLTVVFTVFTGMTLTIALAISLYMAVQQKQEQFADNFNQLFNQILYHASADESLSTNWFTELEKQEQVILFVNVNGEPVDFEPGWALGEDRKELLQKFMGITGFSISDDSSNATNMVGKVSVSDVEPTGEETVGTDGSTSNSLVISSGSWSDRYPFVDSQNNPYQGAMFSSRSIDNTKVVTVMMFQDLSKQNHQLFLLYLTYGGIWLIGLIALFLINFFLAKKILQSTEENIKEQADFVAAASHELRSPLTVVNSSLSAAEVAPDEKEAQKYRRAAQAETLRMGRLVDDLLLLAGGDAARWKLRPEPVDLDTVLIETAEQYISLASQQDINLTLDLPEETLPGIKGDKDRIRQILAVLLDNALQYAPAKSEISLRAERKRHRVVIKVIDHGPGVLEEDKEHLFDRFYRADKSRNQKEHFGLGLSVAQELAQLHHGNLHVQDTPGGGATFCLELPIRNN